MGNRRGEPNPALYRPSHDAFRDMRCIKMLLVELGDGSVESRKWSDFVDWLRYEYGIDLSLSRHEGEHQQTTVQIVLKV